MNDNNTLRGLENGIVTREIPTSDKAAVVQAVVTSPGATQVTQIGLPVDFSNIQIGNLVDNDDNVIEFNFQNSTGATQTVYISGLFGQPGDSEAYNLPPSAVDFPNFLELNSDLPQNAGVLKGFNSRIRVMPIIIKTFTIQTTDLAQSNQKLIVGKLTKTLNKMETGKIPSLCDACYNNNDNAYTKEFKGPFGIGMANYLGYKVLNGVSVMVRLELVGEAKVAQFSAE